ncbi:MAG: cache domain-containing protein, partial [Salinisphaeraceae bacterium]|nr:cache domain-containing protein [Salinisphaeraceae bacterium]
MNKLSGRLGLRGRLLLQSSIVLLVMLGSLVWLGRGQMLEQYTQQRSVVIEQQQRLLGSLLQAAAEATLGLAGPVSTILGLNEDSLPAGDALANRVGQNEDSLAVELGLEALVLFDAKGELLFARDLYALGDYDTAWLAELARKAMARGSPSTDLRCSPACRLTVLAPVIGGNGQAYLLAMSRSIGQVLVDFQRISQADLILLAPSGGN